VYADYLGQIYHNKAKIEGNSLSIAEICNAEAVNLNIKMRAHELLEVPFLYSTNCILLLLNISCLTLTSLSTLTYSLIRILCK